MNILRKRLNKEIVLSQFTPKKEINKNRLLTKNRNINYTPP
jgi:hypothetical protein